MTTFSIEVPLFLCGWSAGRFQDNGAEQVVGKIVCSVGLAPAVRYGTAGAGKREKMVKERLEISDT